MRRGIVRRSTTETDIAVELALDERGSAEISTGIVMFDHLLAQFAFHSGCTLRVSARSLDSLAHHLIEDVAIALGTALRDALGERRGIVRFGSSHVAMDDALARVVVDLGGRAYSRTDLRVTVERIEDMASVMIPHVFTSLASAAGLTVHADVLAGADPHHCVEAVFKAAGRACATAWALAPDALSIVPSTKGIL